MMASTFHPSRGLGGAFQPAKAQQPFAPRRSVVALAKPTRAADFRGLNNEEILGKIAELKERQFQLKYLYRSRGVVLSHTTPDAQPDPEKVPKGHEFKDARRQMAQLWTILRERQIQDGISQRDARTLKSRVAVKAGMGGL